MWDEQRRQAASERMAAIQNGTFQAAPKKQGFKKIVVTDEDAQIIMKLIDERTALKERAAKLRAEQANIARELLCLTNKSIAEKFEYTEKQISNFLSGARGWSIT